MSKFLFHGVSVWGLPEGPPGSHKVHSQEKVTVKVSTLELGWKLLAGVSFLTWARHSRRLPPDLWDVVVGEGGRVCAG